VTAPALSVVVPAYDEAEHLAENLRRLVDCLERTPRPFEVLVVDDGSRDGTAAAAETVAASDARVRVLRHPRNLGKGAALATGCAAARGAVLALLDADLEIPPEEVPALVALLETSGADLAVGSKYHPRATLRWPWHRRALSRLYHLATALLFRLPLRDTQTGLKALRLEAARDLVPRLTSRRFAWDVELLLLAHRRGRRAVTGPVRVEPSSRASRVTPLGALLAGWDTFRIFLRDRGLGAYGGTRRRGARPPVARLVVSGDDLGLSPSVDEGLLRGLEASALTSVSALARSPRALAALRARAPGSDVGLHVELPVGRGLARFLLRGLAGGVARAGVEAAVREQAAELRRLGAAPTHVDAHRHAYAPPSVRRAVARASARAGIPAIRSLRPLGPLLGAGLPEAGKRLVLHAAAVLSAGTPRALGLVSPDGFVGALEAARWVRLGRVPAYARGRTVEVIAHPAFGASDLPAGERGTLDRDAETRAVLDPPLAQALRSLGADVTDFRTLVSTSRR
jgi:predicted glycoside hydrolase/deacetylase ChbG (UPF0249 family)